jgi:hypothetical protein
MPDRRYRVGWRFTNWTTFHKESDLKDKRIYVEKRPDGDYAVRRANFDRASDVLPTQRAAIERARELSPDSRPHVERVRNTSGGSPDKWRKA